MASQWTVSAGIRTKQRFGHQFPQQWHKPSFKPQHLLEGVYQNHANQNPHSLVDCRRARSRVFQHTRNRARFVVYPYGFTRTDERAADQMAERTSPYKATRSDRQRQLWAAGIPGWAAEIRRTGTQRKTRRHRGCLGGNDSVPEGWTPGADRRPV